MTGKPMHWIFLECMFLIPESRPVSRPLLRVVVTSCDLGWHLLSVTCIQNTPPPQVHNSVFCFKLKPCYFLTLNNNNNNNNNNFINNNYDSLYGTVTRPCR